MWWWIRTYWSFPFEFVVDVFIVLFKSNIPRDHRSADCAWFSEYEDNLETVEMVTFANVLILAWLFGFLVLT